MTRVRAAAAAAVLFLTASLAAAQVTPPLVTPLTPDSTSLSGQCVSGATVKATAEFNTFKINLPDAQCASGSFSIDISKLSVTGTIVFSVSQEFKGMTSAGTNASVTRAVSAPKPPPPLADTVYAGISSLTGMCTPGAKVRSQARLKDAKAPATAKIPIVTLDDADCGTDGRFSIDLRDVPVRDGYLVTLSQVVNGVASDVMEIPVEPRRAYDQRPNFEATAYLGVGIDNFAAQEIQNYINPEANGETHERSVFGFDFAYRLAGWRRQQLWVYGETTHGVRSEDINCQAAPKVPSCANSLAEFATDFEQTPLFMLRNASSLESHFGFRVELWPINISSPHPAMVYVNVQPGFLMVAGSDGDAKDQHHISGGARVIGGGFSGSYMEIGWGRTDLFAKNRRKRIIIDAAMLRDIGCGVFLFAQLWSDVDGSSGADSIQSYFGLSFDVRETAGTVANLFRRGQSENGCLTQAAR